MKVILLTLLGFATTLQALAQPAVIPLPQSFSKGNDTFSLSNKTAIVVNENALKDEAWYLQKELLRLNGITTTIQEQKKETTIFLSKDSKHKAIIGSYQINMSGTEVRLSASDEEGVFNGISTLLQLVATAKNSNGVFRLECWNIFDAPKYSWRGLMLDESRHFYGKEKVKSILNWMAFYKLNKFHWHLTDEPGWRIEIKKYPFLSLIGGIGNYTDSIAAPKFYTQEDIKDIVAYASERKIEVIPEIDMPGHARAANRAYPQFSGGGSAKYPDFTFDPGKPATYQYLTDVLKEVNTLFPSQMIHLGGDEVSFGNEKWNSNEGIKMLMQEKGLKNLKDVEEYFLQRMADSVYSLGSKVLAWDEMASASLPASKSIIFWWRHDQPQQLQTALKNNYPVVLCPRIPFYFDFVQDTSHKVGRKWVKAIAGLNDIYNFDASRYISKDKTQLVLGVQANIWTEHVVTIQRLEYMLFPRISALAEAAWSNTKNYENFLERLKPHQTIYKKEGIFYYNPFNPSSNAEPLK